MDAGEVLISLFWFIATYPVLMRNRWYDHDGESYSLICVSFVILAGIAILTIGLLTGEISFRCGTCR